MNWFNALKTLTIIALICLLNARHFASAEILADDDGKNFDDKFQEPSNDDIEIASKRSWQQLHGSWGKRMVTDREQPLEQKPQIADDVNANNLDYLYGVGPRISQNLNDKRTWKTMNNSWRKRDWAQLRNNGWGKKREPNNWNNLRGLWGKRSSPQLTWNKAESDI